LGFGGWEGEEGEGEGGGGVLESFGSVGGEEEERWGGGVERWGLVLTSFNEK